MHSVVLGPEELQKKILSVKSSHLATVSFTNEIIGVALT